MSEHTKEPWSISHDAHDGWPLVMAEGKIIANVNLETFSAGVADLIEMPAEANARRIVACVNRLSKFTTEQIEDHGYDLADTASPKERIWLIERQRDKLLDELRRVVAGDRGLDHARELIAEIEAEK